MFVVTTLVCPIMFILWLGVGDALVLLTESHKCLLARLEFKLCSLDADHSPVRYIHKGLQQTTQLRHIGKSRDNRSGASGGS